ncbi:MAG TPA: serine/threonine-protein kinase [Flavobacteriales bacterium]|nr:serine/threonine-protein kinase [Flavobacteriales bacterium]HMR28890.1 serine/threonine-protein kinase [Flavobacteriales bacterium]
MASSISFSAGERVGKHELIEFIGKGGYGQVWLANDLNLDHQFAVKFLDQAEAAVDEHLREAKLGIQLKNPNLVRVHYADAVEHGAHKLVAIAMDYHPRKSLVHNLEPAQMIRLPNVLKYSIEVLRGLGVLHGLGMIHGDVKPSNILINGYGQAALTDYGISVHSPSGGPVPLRGHYGPHVAPEMLLHNAVLPQTDIYQLGMTIYRLLSGTEVIKRKKRDLGDGAYYNLVTQGKVIGKNEWPPHIPRKVRSVLTRAMAVDPADRYETPLEMQRALEALDYPGYWIATPNGMEGHTERHVYRYKIDHTDGKVFNFVGYCLHRKTGHENRVSNYCSRDLNRTDAMDIQHRFMQYVVTGKEH